MASVAGGLTVPRKAPRKLVIQQAELQPDQDGDQILVVVGVEHPGFFPECTLKEARTTDVHGKPERGPTAAAAPRAHGSNTEPRARHADWRAPEQHRSGGNSR